MGFNILNHLIWQTTRISVVKHMCLYKNFRHFPKWPPFWKMAQIFVGPQDFLNQGPLRDNPANFYACIHMWKVFALICPTIKQFRKSKLAFNKCEFWPASSHHYLFEYWQHITLLRHHVVQLFTVYNWITSCKVVFIFSTSFGVGAGPGFLTINLQIN